jgi:hypothetical protein
MTTPATETTILCDAVLNEVERAVVGKRAALIERSSVWARLA